MAKAYEDESGQPRFGKRLSGEELAAFERRRAELAEQERQRREEKSGKSARSWEKDSARRGAQSAVPAVPAWKRAEKPRKGRWRLLIIGLITMIVVPLIMSFGAVLYAFGSSISDVTPLDASGQIYLEKSAEVTIYSSSPQVITTDCAVENASGGEEHLSPVNDAFPYGSFTASESGTYTITCPQGTSDLLVGPFLSTHKIDLIETVILGAILVGLVGLGLTIAGYIQGISRK